MRYWVFTYPFKTNKFNMPINPWLTLNYCHLRMNYSLKTAVHLTSNWHEAQRYYYQFTAYRSK